MRKPFRRLRSLHPQMSEQSSEAHGFARAPSGQGRRPHDLQNSIADSHGVVRRLPARSDALHLHKRQAIDHLCKPSPA